MQMMPDAPKNWPRVSKLIAVLTRFGTRLIYAGLGWFLVRFVFSLFAMGACSTTQPQPEYGKTFHLSEAFGKLLYCDGYVKPWIGHTLRFIDAVGLAMLAAVALLAFALFVLRSIADEWG